MLLSLACQANVIPLQFGIDADLRRGYDGSSTPAPDSCTVERVRYREMD